MKRRAFIAGLAGVTADPFATLAQTSKGKLPRVAVLWHAGNAEEEKIPLTALVAGLRDASLVNGQTMILEQRFPNEEPERFKTMAAELVSLQPDILVAVTRQAAIAARQATSRIPIFFLSVPDPVESGIVASLARPGSNATGFSSMSVELIPKRIEILIDAVPAIRHIALVINGNFENGVRANRSAAEAAATHLGIKIEPFLIRSVADFKPVFAAIQASGARGVVLAQDGLFYANMDLFGTLAIEHRLAMMAYSKEMVEAGALISYGADLPVYFRRAGPYIARILAGAKPSDIPVEQPTKFGLSLNVKTAMALGIVFPPTLLTRADGVIE
jgi:putative tryptophan/tyrosine transport system substrate-binding protein